MLDRAKAEPGAAPSAPMDDTNVVHAAVADAPQLPSPRRRSLRVPLMAGGVLVVVLGAGVAWFTGGRYVSTDDAYVRAAKLMVSTDVSGLVTEVDVHEGQAVTKGEVLFRVDPRAFQIALDNAKANLEEIALGIRAMKADYQRMLSDIAAQENIVANDQATFDRYDVLVKANTAISKATFDQGRFALAADERKLDGLRHQAEVQLAKLGGNAEVVVEQHPQYLQAKAVVDEAQRQLDHTTVRAPFSGIATAVDTLQPGLYLVAQTAALTNQGAVGLVSTDDVWIDANIKETDLTHVKAGDPVNVTVDAYPGAVWHGVVDSISPASGSEFSILPAQNASGNWVKVVQRIPVRIKVERKPGDPRLRAGMSVVVDIDTGHARKLAELF
ncbi:HlyD family secretion protein [Xanthobacter sp. NM-25]|uniref:HlyD family secretion protein n=2 Tax=unclassified Xanthobacter TaxID=2623496 RepID=UPI001EE0E468|nr:HlyD family secretion protein [Xanthobacter sp. NM-25]